MDSTQNPSIENTSHTEKTGHTETTETTEPPAPYDETLMDHTTIIEMDEFNTENISGREYPNPLEDDARPTTIEHIERPEDDILILELLTEDITLDPGILVYLDGDDILIPLSVFTELLEFPITVDTATGVASGWFLNEDNTFRLTPPYQNVTIKNTDIPIKNGMIEPHLEDIYISTNLIETWFPITLDLNFNELRLYMTVSEDLPFQVRARRQQKWEKAKLQNKPHVEIKGEIIKLPYRQFSAPAVQVTHNASFNKSNKITSGSTSHSVSAQGDLLGMQARTNFNYNTDHNGKKEFENIQFTMMKEDFEGKIAGPLNATNLEIGDTNSGLIPLAGGQQRGRGFAINNHPLNFVRDPNEFVIEGDAPIGWDVEVYQDQYLLDFAPIGTDGRYAFDTIPLKEGFNLFRIVLYGPNGEKRERFERFYLGPGMVEPGKFLYEVSGLQSSTPLVNVSTQNQADTPHTLAMSGEYGLHKNLSVSGGYYQGPLGSGTLDAATLGARLSTTHAFVQADTLRDKSGAYSYQLNATGRLGKNTTWRANHQKHNDYAMGLRSVVEQSSINLSQQFSLKLIPIGNYSLEAKREKSDTGTVTDSVINRISGTLLGLNLNNQLEYEVRDTGNQDPDVTGQLTLRGRISNSTLRGRFNYNLNDSVTAESADLQIQHKLTPHLFLNANINSQFTGEKETTLSGGLDVKADKMRFGFNASGSTEGDTRFGMNLAYNFVPRSLYGDYEMTSENTDISLGQLVVEPFLDENQNGIWDEGEEKLHGVKFKNMLRGTKGQTNDEGQAIIRGLTPNIVNRISLDGATLPDIYMTPANKYTNVLGKSGVNGPLSIPIHQLGEISGTLIAQTDQGEAAIAGIHMMLLNEKDEVVAETYSEYDGFYIFPSLKMGRYQVYFPYSEEFGAYYTGEGDGPEVILSIEESEQSGADILVKKEEIHFK